MMTSNEIKTYTGEIFVYFKSQKIDILNDAAVKVHF